MTEYLLPCHCGQKLLVGPAQAGQSLPCSFGAMLDVPTLRALRQLEPSHPATPRNGSWGTREKLFFAGLMILLLALVPGSCAWWLRPPALPPADRQGFRNQLDRLSVLETMILWNRLAQGPQSALRPAEIQLAETVVKYHVWLGLAIAAALAGLGCCGSALFVRSSSIK